MTTRSQSRRRKGATRMKPTQQQPDALRWNNEEVHEWAESEAFSSGDEAWDCRRYWTRKLDAPLFVYFIQAEDGGPVKIGKAKNPVSRLAELQCGNPRDLRIKHLILSAPETERELHDALRAWHVRGEWFGEGLEEAILELARETSVRQISEHRLGASMESCAEWVPRDVFKARERSAWS